MKTGWGIAYGVVCGLAAAAALFLTMQKPRGQPITLSPPPPPAPVVVHVLGAVVQPGVYTLPAGSRVQDALTAAGGLTAQANPASLNLAAPLQDGSQILVSTQPPTAVPPSGSSTPAPQSGNAGSAAAPPATTSTLININTATLEELDSLPGIGPAIAQRIIDYRTTNGPFTKIEDITNVSGIGAATFEKIKGLITVGP